MRYICIRSNGYVRLTLRCDGQAHRSSDLRIGSIGTDHKIESLDRDCPLTNIGQIYLNTPVLQFAECSKSTLRPNFDSKSPRLFK